MLSSCEGALVKDEGLDSEMRALAIHFLAICLALAFFSSTTEARSKLSKAEVQRIFIGKSWRGPSGSFLFSRNGTYKFHHWQRGETFGPWRYKLGNDGVIRSDYTNYRFYRKSNGRYEYHHSQSNRFYPARP